MAAAAAIWKFQLHPWTETVEMPAGARLLHAHEQAGQVCVWALVNPAAPRVKRLLSVIGTGFTPSADEAYVGTAHIVEQGLVLHVFDGGEASS